MAYEEPIKGIQITYQHREGADSKIVAGFIRDKLAENNLSTPIGEILKQYPLDYLKTLEREIIITLPEDLEAWYNTK